MRYRCAAVVFAEPLEPRRLLAGEFDSTFGGGDGIVTTDFTGNLERARAVTLYPDGRIVAVGFGSAGTETGSDWMIARYLPDGTLDNTFHDDGRIIEDVSGTNDQAWSAVVQPDGKLLV